MGGQTGSILLRLGFLIRTVDDRPIPFGAGDVVDVYWDPASARYVAQGKTNVIGPDGKTGWKRGAILFLGLLSLGFSSVLTSSQSRALDASWTDLR